MTHTVWFLTLPGVMVLDLTGPAETLKLAGDRFSLRYIGPQPEVVCSTGMTIGSI
ncbi:GlxA family transcriptional regulator, partial [Pantoea sp. M_5]